MTMMKTSIIELEKIRLLLDYRISQEIIKDIVNPPQTEIFFDHIAKQVVFRVHMYILGEKIGSEIITHPTGWFEWLKQSFYEWLSYPGGGHMPWLGDYLKKKYPVIMTTHTVNVQTFYPNISLPNERYFVKIEKQSDIS